MKYTNEEIARNENLWDEYYNTSGLCAFNSISFEERLADLNRDYPDISSAAATLGRKGGKSRSPAKVDAVRENGKKGGRPGYAERVEIDSSANRKLEREVRFGKVFWLVTIWPSGATLPSVPLSVKEFRRLKEAREYFELP